MRFYTKEHKYYCGIDLHARTMFICILDQAGEIVFHRNKRATAEAFLKVSSIFSDLIWWIGDRNSFYNQHYGSMKKYRSSLPRR